ncbi:MAG: CotH kinase family protein [bacterium]|nr:MAG: CotH kinase family protein [bacterium]
MFRVLSISLIILFNTGVGIAQKLVINEVMSANVSTIFDEDDDYPDWIEIYNADTNRIDLNNFGLSDDKLNPLRWTFPGIVIEPNNFLLIFASGKDVRSIPKHWETVIDWGDQWKYITPQSEPASAWRTIGFDDSDWLSGPSGFGYNDDDDSTDVGSPDPFLPSPISVFVRKKIIINNVNDIIGAILHVDYDDGFVAYLNSEEIARSNMGLVGTIPAFNQFADVSREAAMYRGGKPEKFVVENIRSLLQAGENILAMQVHNVELYSSDLTLIPFFTLEMTTVPANPRGISPHLSFPTSRKLHANFKINVAGETLLLSNNSGEIIDSLNTGYLPADVSLGRQPDGSSNWLFFDEATPGASNNTQGYKSLASAPQFSHPGGFYESRVLLELSVDSPGVTIRYTMDGSAPADSSFIYNSPISIDSTTVIRARVFGNNLLPGKTITHTFFINQQFTLPVISLATDPANFWDNEIGIYVYGDSADTVNYPYWGSNFWEDWERPIHIEFYEPDGQPGFSIDAGVKIFGSWSRLYPQKALAIFARTRYGYSEIDYQIFPDKPITKFQSIILRNSGQDWGRTFFRDGMIQSLVKDTDIDIQAYRPAMVFLNGEIWGIHNIREKMSEHYLASNRGVDPDNLDFIERDSMIIKGDTQHYQNLLNYIATHDMSLKSSYDFVKTQIDVDNFIDYTLSVIYFANPDWPWNNVKCWRPKTQDGKWKWLLFDLDYCFHGGHLGPDANIFNEMRNQHNGTTLLFFKLMENEEHKNNFINHFADYLNTNFEPWRVVQTINQFKVGIEPEMPVHIAKWNFTFQGPWWLGKSIDSMQEWYDHILVPIDFASRRPDYLRQQIVNEFNLMDGGIGTVFLNVSPAASGRIKINSKIIKAYPWGGQYFPDVPIQLTAIPKTGYRFAGWNGVTPADSCSIKFHFSNNQLIMAKFEPDSGASGKIVINEINYKSASNFNTEDWIEFYNNSGSTFDISSYIFTNSDETHSFTFPDNTIIEANELIVLCRDKSAFAQFFPGVNNCLGELNFGLSSRGELVRLYDAAGNLVDSLTYDEQPPWSEQPNGNGPTLELKHPDLDNSLAQSWAASKNIGGTPGAPNSVLSSVSNHEAQQPLTFKLYQNFPNPFNSQTSIQFSLPQAERVSLKIFNTLGEEVKVLIDKNLPAGIYKMIWSGTDKNGIKTSSGIYFCKLETNSFQQVKKMILIQ